MDGQLYNLSNGTHCSLNISDSEYLMTQEQAVRILSIIIILVLLFPTLILQLFFICRYKSTFLHRQFLYITIFVLLYYIFFIVYLITVDVGCFFALFVGSLGRYLFCVEIMQITTIHLLLLYKLCKYMQTRTMQQLQALCCNIRPCLWHEVMIVCIQLGLPLPVLIVEIVVILKTNSIYSFLSIAPSLSDTMV